MWSQRTSPSPLLITVTHKHPAPTHLDGVAAHAGGPPRPRRPRTLPAGHQEELGQPLLHQAGEALVVGLQGGALHILDHWGGETRERGEKGGRTEEAR